MPVLAVNSFGVSAAMSFICGLSTIATLIEPPFDELEPEEPLEPPQAAARAPRTTTRVAAQLRRDMADMGVSLLLQSNELRCPDLYVGSCWLSTEFAEIQR